MTETTNLKLIYLSDIKKLESGKRFTVNRSGRANCIYECLNAKEDELIQITIPRQQNWGSSMFNRNTRVDEYYANINVLKSSDVSSYYLETSEKIYVVSEHPINLVFSSSNWYQTLLFDSSKELKVTYERRDSKDTEKWNFVKKDEKYFIDIRNYLVPIESFKYNYGSGDAYRLSYSLGATRLDISSLSREDLNGIAKAMCDNSEKLSDKPEGVTKLMKTLVPFYEAESDFMAKLAFCTAINLSKKTFNSVKFSVVLNKVFGEITTQSEFTQVCIKLSSLMFDAKNMYSNERYVGNILNTLDDAKEIFKASLKKKSTGAFNKIMQDLDFVTINPETHPITHAAVYSGEIPLGTFFRKSGESYFVYNDNWDLWEVMLKDYKETAIEIAKNCSGRTTYEKDIMSYFYFTLYELPEYLEQQTGRKWKGIPKLVNSANELDPPTAGSNGVAKSRSALTPIVDNENNTVTVPYVSMQIGGYQTTYCYGLSYSVLKRGFTHLGNTVTKDVEKAVNGRDDYGLMFYTLTGTAQGRGYPTFLIIFEKLEKDYTKVHFHRTHPMRSKGGDYNPIHNWTVGCYKWMIGNVNFERIAAQQGDLAFVQIENFPDTDTQLVDAYDNHRFHRPVLFAPYTKKDKQNVLGYVQLENDTILLHNEHMCRTIPAGNYEIRQCRSWEANPLGIWSLRID